MIFLEFILLIVPGMIAWRVSENAFPESGIAMAKMIVESLIYDFIIIAVDYIVITILKGTSNISFSTQPIDAIYNVYSSGFVCKYALISAVVAMLIGIAKRVIIKIRNK